MERSTNPTITHPIHISAPSKIILHGEHSVVYGKLAVATSVQLRLNVKVRPNKEFLVLDFPAVGFKHCWKLEDVQGLFKDIPHDVDTPTEITDAQRTSFNHFISSLNLTDSIQIASLTSFLFLYTSILASPLLCDVTVETPAPVGGGMGSSAAYAVALAAAFVTVRKSLPLSPFTPSSLSLITTWSYFSERIVHGTPSGIDNTICTYGGTLTFQSGRTTQIPTLVGTKGLRILLVNTRVTRSTKGMVEGVRGLLERHGKVVGKVLDAMHEVSCEAVGLWRQDGKGGSGEGRKLGELISMNHSLLTTLGVSHPSLEIIVTTATSYNLHAKLTGAGGGGLAFVLLTPDVSEEVVQEFTEEMTQKCGFEVWITDIGGEGVKRHEWE